MSNFIKRSLTGFLLVAVMIAAILLHSVSALILFFVITYLSLAEFYGLLQKETNICAITVHSLAGSYLVFASFYTAMFEFSKWLLLPYFVYIIFVYLSELYRKSAPSIGSIAFAFLGHLYIALPFSLVAWLGYVHYQIYEPVLILALFVSIWVNDTGAYLVGSQIGKHRLFERISPKKSWEGFIGGLLFSAGVSQLFALYFPVLNHLQWIGFALVVSVAATFGDLFESLIKRHIGIKDSGNILPGHGGMLDRFDAPLFAIPVAAVYLLFCL